MKTIERMDNLRDSFQVGDLLTLNGHCKNGRIDMTAPESDLQLWRVKSVTDEEVVLQPMVSDGVVDAFNDCAGDFRIVRNAESKATA